MAMSRRKPSCVACWWTASLRLRRAMLPPTTGLVSAMSEVDSRAIVSASARIGQNVRIGAFAVVGDAVELGDECVLEPHAVVRGPARIGRKNIFDSFCSVGGDPQDLKFSGERTELVVGQGNHFREFCTVSRGTTQGGGVTRIGDDNLFMAYSHIAHDCN